MIRNVTLIFCALFVLFCGCETFQNSDDWVKEVVIQFRRDTTAFQREQFYNLNSLEFVSQYDENLVKCRIISGESIDDFIDRLSTDPSILYIKSFNTWKLENSEV